MQNKQVDYTLFFLVFSLIIFGMIMISSVSVYSSWRVTSQIVKKGLLSEAHNHFYVFRNIIHVIIAFSVLAVIVKLPYKLFEKYSRYFLRGTIFLLIVVLVIGSSWNGAKGWLNLPFLPFAIQPTEFLKVSLILFLAHFFKKNKKYITNFERGFLPFIFLLGSVVLLIALQPDFGTIMVVAPLSVIMFFVAGGNVKYITVIALLGVVLFSSVYTFGKYDKSIPKTRNKLSYITDRVDNFLSDNKKSIENKTINYQTEQALISIGSAGFTGLGFGNSVQKFGYLPEVQGDFIFSVIIEELGFIGGVILLGLYILIGYRGFYIAYHSKDLFAKYASVGISSRILLQAFINIGVNLNIIPLTGITLPFVSYGGSSLLSTVMGIGILLNLSRNIDTSIGNPRARSKSPFKKGRLFCT